MITRANYEEYFLLYVDNELSAAAKLAVEKFVADNPDLQEEWETLLQCRIEPDTHEVFRDKENLLQADLLSYVDGELDAEGRRAVEELVDRYPAKATELRQLMLTVSTPDGSIVHPDKESLYRTERRRLIFLPWMQAGIAAAVLGLVALLLLTTRHNDGPVHPGGLANIRPAKKNDPQPVTPAAPAPLHIQGSDDQNPDGRGREDQDRNAKNGAGSNGSDPNSARELAKDDPSKRKERQGNDPAPVEKQPQVALRQQEVTRPTTVLPTTTDSHPANPVLVAEVRPDVTKESLIKPAIQTVAAVNIPKEQSSFATQALMEEAQADDDSKEMVAAAPAGKHKLRGLLRKVSRTLGKTADRDEDGQKEVLISAFQVALK